MTKPTTKTNRTASPRRPKPAHAGGMDAVADAAADATAGAAQALQTPPRPIRSSRHQPAPAEPPRVGAALAALRADQAMSLDALSRRAGVSKSMLSQIERGQANPTVAVVWRLAQALGVPLSALLDDAAPAGTPLITQVSNHDTPRLRGADTGCELRILGPIDLAGQIEWYELRLAPGAELASQPHEAGTREHLSLMTGQVQLQVGEQHGRLAAGDTARYAADLPHAIRNAGRSEVLAWLVVMHP